MDKIIIIVLALTLYLSGIKSAYAGDLVTNPGYIACITEQWLDDLTTFLVKKDRASADAYLASGRCLALKGGLSVTLMDTSGWGSKALIALEGVKVWTVSEALKKR